MTININRCDATKHQSLSIVGDAKSTLASVTKALADYQAPNSWLQSAQQKRALWDHYVADNTRFGDRPNSYAQAIGVINHLCDPADRIVAAAGGLPAELTANWQTLKSGTVDIEFGYSCMGYEIAGGWGARIAQSEQAPEQDTIVFTGDGSYLMMNSDIYSSVLSQKKLIIIVLDNGGFAVINKLQNGTGNDSYNNLFSDCPTIPEPFSVDFEAHARSMGATTERVDHCEALQAAFKRAKAAKNSYVICMEVDPYDGWTDQGHAWWEIGTPEVSQSSRVDEAHLTWEQGRARQRRGI